ncbi:unnamed protein product [Candidula unifasciata]|uniref:Uncharacterized protein n=1 Tax=Candidula unifasciata TaxID=100452 RepID=A0A8S3ZUI6_9EUPU|nr:unnamed protein product [Candidula unifasciata]
MNQGDQRKDQAGFLPRRRPQAFDLEENARNGNSFATSSQSLPYSHSMAASYRQPFNYWPPSGYQTHGHPAGTMHRYPGHQMFMQHGPFGGDSDQYRAVGYLPQFRMRFPQNSDHQHPSLFSGESRRNGFDFHCDRRRYDNAAKHRFDFAGPGFRERGFKSDQGARPKSGKFSGNTIKIQKKKSNHNNSSNVSTQDGNADKADDKLKKKSKTKGEVCHNNKLVTSASCTETASSRKYKHSPALENDSEDKTLYCPVSENRESVDLSFCDVEGAVGGDIQENLQIEHMAVQEDVHFCKRSFDKNLIDEGAVCDLDKMFQHQEASCYSSDDSQSDSELRNCTGHADETMIITSCKHNGNLCTNLFDDDSESENCSYVYNPKLAHGRKDMSFSELTPAASVVPSSSTHSVKRHNFSDMVRLDVGSEGRLSLACECGGDNLDDGEDTGDFIDADLPSHNKHILSSSDEMDNISSNSSSDHEGSRELNSNFASRRKRHSEFECNDLSSDEPKVHNELEVLSIDGNSDKWSTALSSRVENNEEIEITRDSSPLLRSATSCSSSSENENGDSSVLDANSFLNSAVGSPVPFVCYSSTSSCLDGAAASQVTLDSSHKLQVDPCNSCPPGAECELPQASPSQYFFHSDMFCCGGIPSSCNGTKSSQSPRREHTAFTASSAPGSSDSCTQMHKQELSGCSATSGSGACCPPSYQLSQVNDLNACCHHSHSHVANGFCRDGPETNFNSDSSNLHQKVFAKFPVEDAVNDRGSHTASSGDPEDMDGFFGRKLDKNSDNGGSEDPLSHDSEDNVDMVLLPMEEEIEPVHHMGAGLCAGGVEDSDEFYQDLQLATSGALRGTNMLHLCDDHQYLCVHDQNPLRNGMPSKEFYDLIKTVSTTDSFMRFFDKDGQDVQRQPVTSCEDDDDENSKENGTSGGQNSKTERLKVDRVMIWNEYEAYVMQFKQIAVSACGQTAVLNVLKALKFNFEKSAVCKIIQTSLRKEDASIPEYLFSRAKAGTTAEELLLGVEKLSGGAVGGRFFHFWPPRNVKLLQWLAYWMKRGAIPIATLNLQQGPHSLWQVPDSWHHQMVYGVSHQGLYLTNPLEIVSERSAMKQLCSDSVLMVRRQDIISRFRETTDLSHLLSHADPRWRTMNVLGQVVNVLREFNMPSVPGYRLQVTSHITIPASYKAGITLFMPKDKSAWTTLMNAPEIPLEEC